LELGYRFRRTRSGLADNGGNTALEEVLNEVGSPLVALTMESAQATTTARAASAMCEARCPEHRAKLMETGYMVSGSGDKSIRNLFRAIISRTQVYCEGMFKKAFSPSEELKFDSDNTAIYPAMQYCKDKKDIFEQHICEGVRNALKELMVSRAGIETNDLLAEHRFMYMATAVLENDPNMVSLRWAQHPRNLLPDVPDDFVPEGSYEASVKGPAVSPVLGDPKKRRLGLGLYDPGQDIEADATRRLSWEPEEHAAKFCTELLPAQSKRSQHEPAPWEKTLAHLTRDPLVRLEQHTTEFQRIRTEIVKNKQATEASGGDAQAIERLATAEKVLSERLWCAHYQMERSRYALELRNNERDINMAQCFMCIRSGMGWKPADTCKFFPEKPTVPKKNAAAATQSRFRAAGEADPVLRFSGAGTHIHEASSRDLVMDSLAGGVTRATRAAASEGDGKPKKGKTNANQLAMMTPWNVMQGSKVSCGQALVIPEEADAAQLLLMKETIKGPQITKAKCIADLGSLMAGLHSKRDMLAGVQGSALEDRLYCTVTKASAGKQETGQCMKNAFTQFSRLKKKIFTAQSQIREEFAVARGMFRDYGKKGPTVCQDLGFCPSDNVEDYVKRWVNSYRESRDRAQAQDKKGSPIQGKYVHVAPGHSAPDLLKGLSENFTPAVAVNPAAGVRTVPS